MCQWCSDPKADPEIAQMFHTAYERRQQELAGLPLTPYTSTEERRRLKRKKLNRQRSAARKRERLEQGNICHYCGEPADTVDHIVPTSKGGPRHNTRNLVPCCDKCNQDKADKLPTCQCEKCIQALELFYNPPNHPPRSTDGIRRLF